MYNDLIRPRKRYYFILPAVCIMIGWGVPFGIFVHNLTSVTRYVFPGSHPIEFQEAGSYLVLYEYETTIENKSYSTTPDITDLSVDIGGAFRTKVPLDLRDSSGLNMPGSRAKAIASLWITYPERVRFSAGYRSGKLEPEFVLSIIPSEKLESLTQKATWAGTMMLLGFVFAVFSPIFIWQRRRKSQIQLAQQYYKAKRTVP